VVLAQERKLESEAESLEESSSLGSLLELLRNQSQEAAGQQQQEKQRWPILQINLLLLPTLLTLVRIIQSIRRHHMMGIRVTCLHNLLKEHRTRDTLLRCIRILKHRYFSGLQSQHDDTLNRQISLNTLGKVNHCPQVPIVLLLLDQSIHMAEVVNGALVAATSISFSHSMIQDTREACLPNTVADQCNPRVKGPANIHHTRLVREVKRLRASCLLKELDMRWVPVGRYGP
jgi:hypothetical protein